MPRIYGSSIHNGYYYVDYSYTQNISGNYTDVTWVAGQHFGDYNMHLFSGSLALGFTVGSSYTVISGSSGFSGYDSGYPIPGTSTNMDFTFSGGTIRIFHDTSGHGNITFSGSLSYNYPENFTSYLSTAISLPDIPRGAPAPAAPTIGTITATSVAVSFSDPAGSYAPLTNRKIYWGTDPVTPQFSNTGSGSWTVSPLTPGTTYYFWGSVVNSVGESPLSARSQATTLGVPQAPSQPTLSNITQTTVDVSWTPNGDGGSPITGYEVGYSTTTTPPGSGTAATSPYHQTGLTPGVTYYFWVRAQNAVGWGPWSAVASTTAIAGVRINVAGTWKLAIPYVKDAGTWKLARPWTKWVGVWKETI